MAHHHNGVSACLVNCTVSTGQTDGQTDGLGATHKRPPNGRLLTTMPTLLILTRVLLSIWLNLQYAVVV